SGGLSVMASRCLRIPKPTDAWAHLPRMFDGEPPVDYVAGNKGTDLRSRAAKNKDPSPDREVRSMHEVSSMRAPNRKSALELGCRPMPPRLRPQSGASGNAGVSYAAELRKLS